MALYSNGTRFAAILTIRINAVSDPKKTLMVGTPSAMYVVALEVGFHDLLVEPGESIELGQGVDAEFIATRGAV